MKDILKTAPIIFIFFNRPDYTQIVFEQIKLAKPSKLFLISDGPRDDNNEDIILCAKSRKIVENIDWKCDVKINYSQFNLGCKKRVSSGISWAFNFTEEAIILEDDCVPNMSFFLFCTELLIKYKNHDNIYQINGSCFLNIITIKESYFFSKYNHTWGWATWKRAWDKFEIENDNFENDFKSISFHSVNERKYWHKIFLKYFSGEIDTWDYPWMFTMWKNRGLSVYPTKNMVKNIGFREDATHTKSKSKFENMSLQNINKLSHPAHIFQNQKLDAENFEYVFLNNDIYSKQSNLQDDACITQLFDEGKNALSDMNYDKALHFFSKIKSFKHTQESVDYFRALCFYEKNDISSAIESLKEELRYFPYNTEAILFLNKINKIHYKTKNFVTEIDFILNVIRNYTMLGKERLYSLYNLTKKICELDLPGNFVECGVAAGGSSALIAYVIKKYSNRTRLLYSFDTFEGMPEPTVNDTHRNIAANDTGWGIGTCSANENSLLEICGKMNVKDIVLPIRGFFKDTLPQKSKIIGDIAFLHMDGDWYDSTLDILNNLYEQVIPQGYIQVDDYGHWDGCKKALHEYESKLGVRFDLHRIDNTGVWFRKPDSPAEISRSRLLNLGCGKRHHPAWTNVDFKSGDPDVIAHDLSKGLPFSDESFEAIYHSHLLEHFSKNYAPVFLKDCFRVLKPGGIIRVVAPDLESIVRLYLLLLEKSVKGDTEAQNRYDWIMLELFDQMVRNHSGGAMLEYWRQNPMPVEDFVIERLGSEVINAITKIRSNPNSANQPNRQSGNTLDPLKLGQFRLSGEIHQWMYDRYSLGKMLQEAGFVDIKTCHANESNIADFNSYLLDIEPDGSVRKPDSLFMEARKPEGQNTKILSIHATSQNRPVIAQFCMQDFGGAGTAALRLHEGLTRVGANNTLYVQNIGKWRDKTASLSQTHPSSKNEKFISPEWRAFQTRNQQALSQYPNRPSGLEMFTIPWAANRLKDTPELHNADIINLHWISGTLSIADNVNFLKDKKIVWTLHDMNPFTGGCHYAGECRGYENYCGNCPQLCSNQENDLSQEIWKLKKSAYRELDIEIVVLCDWMAKCVKKSSLLSSFPVHVIPNGLPTDIFKPYPQAKIRESLQVPRDAFVILFGANTVTNARKGFAYLVRALECLKKLTISDQVVLATFGHHAQAAVQHLGLPTFAFDYVDKESELALIYSMADVTVIPSLEDNLPNVVLESLACGTPVVGFDVGGIPDMIEHQVNGYLASAGDVNGLAQGIRWIMDQKKTRNQIHLKCRETTLSRYNLPLQAQRYQELFEKILKN